MSLLLDVCGVEVYITRWCGVYGEVLCYKEVVHYKEMVHTFERPV